MRKVTVGYDLMWADEKNMAAAWYRHGVPFVSKAAARRWATGPHSRTDKVPFSIVRIEAVLEPKVYGKKAGKK